MLRYEKTTNDAMPLAVADDRGVHACWTILADCIRTESSVGTWKTRQANLLKLMNHLGPDDADGVPLVFSNIEMARRAIYKMLSSMEAKPKKIKGGRGGYKIAHAKAALFDALLVLANKVFDYAQRESFCFTPNPTLINGWEDASATLKASMYASETKDGDFRVDVGRYFRITGRKHAAPRTDDPAFFAKVEKALLDFGAPDGVRTAYALLEEMICRPDEAISMPMASLFGGSATPEHPMIKDKFSDGLLSKEASIGKRRLALLKAYFDGPRRFLDRRGWGWAQYQRACRAGDPEALAAAVFLNTRGGPLRYKNFIDTWFRPAMLKAKLLYQGRLVVPHLTRHEGVNGAFSEIDAMLIPESEKEVLRARFCERIGWTSPATRKIYTAHSVKKQLRGVMRDYQKARDVAAERLARSPVPTFQIKSRPATLQHMFDRSGL